MKKIVFTILLFCFVLIAKAQEPMVLVFDTNLDDGTTVSLPLYGTVNVTVDWGDGNIENFIKTRF